MNYDIHTFNDDDDDDDDNDDDDISSPNIPYSSVEFESYLVLHSFTSLFYKEFSSLTRKPMHLLAS